MNKKLKRYKFVKKIVFVKFFWIKRIRINATVFYFLKSLFKNIINL